MKKLLAIVLMLGVIGCGKKVETTQDNTTVVTDTAAVAPSNMPAPMAGKTDVSNQKSSLIVTKSNYSLPTGNPVDTSLVELSCGCHFDFIVEGYSGDTNAIKYKQIDAKTAQSHRVGIRFAGNPKAEKGSHEVKLAFLNTGSKGDYRDTITVKYTN